MAQLAVSAIRPEARDGIDTSPLGAERQFWLFAAAWVAGSSERLEWLGENLAALRGRLDQGGAVSLYLPRHDMTIETRNRRRFDRWAASHFPGL